MKRIAILGDPESIWIKTYVNEVLNRRYFYVVILTDKSVPEGLQEEYPDNVRILSCTNAEWTKRIKISKYIYLVKAYETLKREGKLDYLHIHFVNNRKLLLSKMVRHLVGNIIITFWGSDLLRKSNKELIKFENYLEHSDRITVGSNDMKIFFYKVFSPQICEKMSVVRFGVNGLSAIYNLKQNNNELRNKWDIPIDKIVISVGYNGSKQQNHLDVLDSLNNIPNEMKEKIDKCKEMLIDGSSFPEALLASKIFTSFYAQMVDVGFKSGSMDKAMKQIADRFERETQRKISSIISIIEPILVIILSIIVGMILLSVIMPLMGIMTTIG